MVPSFQAIDGALPDMPAVRATTDIAGQLHATSLVSESYSNFTPSSCAAL